MKLLLLLAALLAAAVAASGQLVVLRADVAVVQSVLPRFSAELRMRGVTHGKVRMLVRIDPEGRPAEWRVIAYTRKELADEAEKVMGEWRFAPGRLGDRPVEVQTELIFDFKVSDVVVNATVVDHLDNYFARLDLERYEYQPCSLKQIDRIPVPIRTVAPAYPAEVRAKGASGIVLVYFLIDEQGEVRMPAVMKSDFPELAESAIAAVRQWRFEPPARRGHPVAVSAVQAFQFAPK